MPILTDLRIRRTIWQEVLLDCATRGITLPEGKVVYFIEGIDTGLVKIGKAIDLRNRWVQLRNASPTELRLIKALPGYTDEERWTHTLFEEHQIKGEWFELEPIRDRIGELTLLGASPTEYSERCVVIGSCGCEKTVAKKGAWLAKKMPCPRCAQLQRFSKMTLDERRSEIAGAKAGEVAWKRRQKGSIPAKVVDRLRAIRCYGCGEPVYANASVSQSAINGNGSSRKYCLNCQPTNFKDETGNVYGELTVIRRVGSDHRGGVVWLLRCAQGHESTRIGTQLRKEARANHQAQCPNCPHVRSPSLW
jgi:hypothetical protein